MINILKAVILAAGYGTRMEPYTETYQKTMLPLYGKPILEYIIEGLISAGIEHFIIVVGYLKNQIIDYFKNGEKWNIQIDYVEQQKLNGTGGALLLCENLIDNNHFFLTWGDILVPYRIYRKVVKIYNSQDEDFILVTNYSDNIQKGCAIYLDGDYCIKMVEKPSKENCNTNLNNCGIFIFSKAIFKALRRIKPSSRGELEIPDAISYGIKAYNWDVRVIKMSKNTFRGDLGDAEVYEKLKRDKNWIKELNRVKM